MITITIKTQIISKVQLGSDPILTFEQGSLVLSPASIIYEYRPLKSYGVLGSLAKTWVGIPLREPTAV